MESWNIRSERLTASQETVAPRNQRRREILRRRCLSGWHTVAGTSPRLPATAWKEASPSPCRWWAG